MRRCHLTRAIPLSVHPVVLGLALGAIAGLPGEAASQARQDSVLLRGRVVEENSGTPIPHVNLAVYDHDRRILRNLETDRDGAFVFVVRRRRGVSIKADRIGYQQNETPFLWFDGHSYFELELRLDPDAILLAPLEVVARSRSQSPVLAGFRHRVNGGMGWYFTRQEIEALRPRMVTDVIAQVPGVHLVSSGSGFRRIVEMSRAAASPTGCPAQVYLDGMHLNSRRGPPDVRVVAIDDYVQPGSVEGIEVYRGLSTVPAEFLNDEAKCGVVVVWTRRGDS